MNNPDILRCIIYARVSTDEQTKGDFTSCDAQEIHCKKLIESKKADGWVYVRTCQDPGVSGRKLNRAGLSDVLTAFKRGHADVVVVYKQDRLSRIAKDLEAIRTLISARGGFVASVTEPSMGTNALGKLVRGLLDQVAEFEVSKGMEIVQDKVRARAEQGLSKPGVASYGYRYDKTTQLLVPIEEEAKVVRRVFAEAAAGRPCVLIAEGLRQDRIKQRPYKRQLRGDEPGASIPHTRHFLPARLREMIANPVYRAVTRAKNPDLREVETPGPNPLPEWREYPAQHPPLVTDEEWHLANNNQATPKKFIPRLTERDKHGYILKGTLVCAKDRCAMSTSYGSKRRPDGSFYRYYRCVRETKEGKDCDCGLKYVPAIGLEDGVLGFIQRMVKEPGLARTLLKNITTNQSDELVLAESQLTQIGPQLEELQHQLKAHTKRITETDGLLCDALREAATKLANERHALRSQQAQLSDRIRTLRSACPGLEQVTAAFSNFVQIVRVLPIEQQKQLITHVFERIEVGRPQSAAYLNAVKAGKSPRMFQVQLFLNTDSMSDLDAIRGGLLPGLRPSANLEATFTIFIPPNGGSPKLVEGNETIDLPDTFSRSDDQGPSTAVNVVARAYGWQKAQDKHPDLSAVDLAKKLEVSSPTLSIHLKILRKVDVSILTYLKHCKDDSTLKWFGLRALLGMAELSGDAQLEAFRRGLADAKLDAEGNTRASA